MDVSHLNEKILVVPDILINELNEIVAKMKNNVKIQFCVDVEFVNKNEEVKSQIFSNSAEEMNQTFFQME